jgi:hypothetical protein
MCIYIFICMTGHVATTISMMTKCVSTATSSGQRRLHAELGSKPGMSILACLQILYTKSVSLRSTYIYIYIYKYKHAHIDTYHLKGLSFIMGAWTTEWDVCSDRLCGMMSRHVKNNPEAKEGGESSRAE